MCERKKEGEKGWLGEGRNEIIWGMTEMCKKKKEREGKRGVREKPRKGNGALTLEPLFSIQAHHRHRPHKHSFSYKRCKYQQYTHSRIAPQESTVFGWPTTVTRFGYT